MVVDPTTLVAELRRHQAELDALRLEIKRMVLEDAQSGDPMTEAFHLAGGMVNGVGRVAYCVDRAVREGGEERDEQ